MNPHGLTASHVPPPRLLLVFAGLCLCLAALVVPHLGCATSGDGEPLTFAPSALSFGALRVYGISATNYPESWCPHGSVATDAAARCNDPGRTVFARFEVDPCVPVAATLTLQRQEWSAAATVDVRRVLRPLVDPPAGLAEACAPSGVAAWDGPGAGLWTVPGAKGWGTDASVEAVSFAVPSNGTQTITVDLALPGGGTLVDACAPTGECVLALYASAHVWEYPGTFSLFVTCAEGGAGGAGGASTSTSSTSSSASGGAGGASTAGGGGACP